ncbi:MAG: LamG-like jellyroll fold domain-containing protein [Deltaproteobacteria bacterium]|nr:LamG-like jellyroll fold domain-containing protein [Deltaproteobacteria bacterium]
MRSSRFRNIIAHIVALSVYLSLFPWPGIRGVPVAQAKVSPLNMITRQLKKGNMLVVLDTSGSMTGVPGEQFDAATELGVDCDLGEGCREVSQTGQCLNATRPCPYATCVGTIPRLCSNDSQCRVGACKYGGDPCLQDFDCPSVGSVCSSTGKPCQYNADCGPQVSTCKLTGAFCSSIVPCAVAGRCADGNAVCNSPGNSCPIRYCSDKPTQTCSADADCQVAAPPNGAPTTGLQVHFKYDEAAGTGTITDHSGTGHTGSFTAGAKRAAGFGGAGSSIDCSDQGWTQGTTANLQLGNTVTISTWVYRKGTGDQKLVSWSGGYEMTLWGDNTFGLVLGGNFGTWPRTSATNVQLNAWNHLAATWNGSQVKLYINGALVSTQSVSQTISTQTKELAVCAGPGPNYYNPVGGQLDNTRVYNSVLSDAEITALYTADSNATPAGLFVHYKFDGDTTDASGNGANASFSTPAYATGVLGQAADSANGDTIVNANAGGNLDKVTDKLTMAAWIYRPSAPALAGDEWILQRQPNGGIEYRLLMGPSAAMYPTVASSGGSVGGGTSPLSLNTWHHVAVTWDGATGTLKTYVEGVKVDESAGAPGALASASGNLFVGSRAGGSANKFNGLIDDFRLYNTVLSDAEIGALVGTNAEPGLVLRLDFEGNGNDSSGKANNAIGYNGATYTAGKYGQAASLSGTAHFEVPAAVGGNLDVGLGTYTITAWFQQNVDVGAGIYSSWIVNRQENVSWADHYGLGIKGPGDFVPQSLTWGGGAGNTRDSVRVTNGTWVFGAATVSPGSAILWKKVGAGAVTNVASTTFTPGSTPAGADVFIGAERDGSAGTDGTNHFQGLIDDVRIYNRVLTQSELEAVAAGNKASSASAGGANLLGHWKWDEGTGVTLADQSSYNHPASVYCWNSVALTRNQTGAGCGNGMPGWVAGHTGSPTDKALSYSYWQYSEVPSTVLDGKVADQFTVSAWVQKKLASSTRWWVHQQDGPNSAGDFMGLWVNGAGKMEFVLDNTSVADTIGPTLNQWYHLVGTYDGANLKLYRDGTLVASTPKSGNCRANSQPILFGAGLNNDRPEEYSDGIISEVAMWNKALTPAEVTALNTGSLPTGSSSFCKPNPCNAQDNSCQGVTPNVCQGGSVNECQGVNTTDTCVINQTNRGPAKMCRLRQTFCAVDSDCTYAGYGTTFAGDECVPATSRSVVAKRVLKNVFLNNEDIMNFGMMGLSQGSADGSTYDRDNNGVVDANDKDNWPDDYYFPYYPVTKNTGSTIYLDRYFTRDELRRNNCYNPKVSNGLAATCVVGPTTYTLRPGVNTRYTVFRGGSFVQVDQPFCGDTCVVSSVSQGYLAYTDPNKVLNGTNNTDARGTSKFAGAIYQYTVPSGDYTDSDKPVFLKTYQGNNTTISGVNYTYFKPRNDYYWDPQAGANRPAIKGAQCSDKCSIQCGGNWDPNLVPFMDTTDVPAAAQANMAKMLPMLEKARDGGFMHWERSPLGCALINDFADGAVPAPLDKKRYSAWNYLDDVKSTDYLPCRDNFILLITDGETNGPGDIEPDPNNPGKMRTSCDVANHPACRVQWDDPNATAAGCPCKSIQNALQLRKSVAQGGLNVKTYVIGFSPDATLGTSFDVNENIARAGGTCRSPFDNTVDPTGAKDHCAFLANNETELQDAIQAVIFDAIKGSYSTTPASATSGTQVDDKKLTPGGILFDARVDFPSWRGHLMAYDTNNIDPVTLQPKLMWDAGSPTNFADIDDSATYSSWTAWKKRRVYTSAGGTMVRFDVEQNSGAILNRDVLLALGLGSTNDEAERIAQWMLGDPRQRNKAVLGAFVNSTPIEVGPPGLTSLPGGRRFFDDNKTRVSLVYAAGDDGMLHAFFTRDTTVGGQTYKGGEEAFAYVPPEMLATLTSVYAQGGQKPDPRKHIFGLTSSPKVKNVCWQNCDDDATAVWKSIMVMTDGWGGTEAFMLDVTTPFVSNNFANPPVNLVWHTDTVMPADKAAYDRALGNTVSVPAFYYGKNTTKDDYRVVMASGYKSETPTDASQGITLVNVSAKMGTLLDADTVTGTACSTTELTTITDVAAARNFDFREQQQMLASYFGDTWGNLWRYVPAQVGANNNTGTTGNLSLVQAVGCQHPLHFAPTVVQLDRDDPLNHPGEIYLVQVTNSALDPQTDAFASSKMIIRKEVRAASSGGVTPDLTWASGGRLEYDVGSSSLCGIWDPSGNSGAGACTQSLPANSRPTGTPLAILKADGTGFVIMSLWFAPPTNVCGQGRSYLLVHTMELGGVGFKQRAGLGLVNEAVTSAVIVDKKVVYTDSQGKVHDVTDQLNQTFLAGGAISDVTRNGGLRFQQTGWVEVP